MPLMHRAVIPIRRPTIADAVLTKFQILLKRVHNASPEPLAENDWRLSVRPPFFSSTPWPLQRGQELRPVVSH